MNNAGTECFGSGCLVNLRGNGLFGMPQDFVLMNLQNHIDNLHLKTGSNFNVNDADAATIDHYLRDGGANVNIGQEVSKDDANQMLNGMEKGN